jgi:hypothetical protein
MTLLKALAMELWHLTNGDFPHHYGKSEKIESNLVTSRGYFLRDDLPNAFFYLGVALHYIQDSYTSLASSYINHHRWEESIEYSNFTNDLIQTINYSLRNEEWERQRCLGLAEVLSKKAQGKDYTLYVATLTGHRPSKSFAEPIVDLNLALRASYVVMESVLSSKNCPELDYKLRMLHLDHENFLQSAEIELSNKIIKLVNERVELEKRKLPQSGIVPKIKNLILEIRIRLKASAVKSNYNYYAKKGHIDDVFREYQNIANRTVDSYSGWYNYIIPNLNPNAVNKELLSLQAVAKVLGITEPTLKESFHKFNISSYQIENMELVKRLELDNFLMQFSVNGFVKCPL